MIATRQTRYLWKNDFELENNSDFPLLESAAVIEWLSFVPISELTTIFFGDVKVYLNRVFKNFELRIPSSGGRGNPRL